MDDLIIARPLVNNLLRFAKQKGANTEMASFGEFAILYESIASETMDHQIGLHVGEQYSLAALGIVGQLIQVSRTIEEGLIEKNSPSLCLGVKRKV